MSTTHALVNAGGGSPAPMMEQPRRLPALQIPQSSQTHLLPSFIQQHLPHQHIEPSHYQYQTYSQGHPNQDQQPRSHFSQDGHSTMPPQNPMRLPSADNMHYVYPGQPMNYSKFSAPPANYQSHPSSTPVERALSIPPSPSSLSTSSPSSPLSKRVLQNREAQRAFRARKRRYLEDLEIKATELNASKTRLEICERENRKLKALVRLLKLQRKYEITTDGQNVTREFDLLKDKFEEEYEMFDEDERVSVG